MPDRDLGQFSFLSIGVHRHLRFPIRTYPSAADSERHESLQVLCHKCKLHADYPGNLQSFELHCTTMFDKRVNLIVNTVGELLI